MIAMPVPWSLFKKRLGSDRKDPMHEWHMPLDDDHLGLAAWSRYATEVGAAFVGDGVSWETPVVVKMQRSLAWAISARARATEAELPLIDRVIADLESYRDTGFSLAGFVEPEAKSA